MYAIIETGGKQYRVQQGEKVKIEKLPMDDGAEVTFDKVLVIGGEGAPKIGTPYVSGASVKGTVIKTAKDKKVIVFKYKNKTNYRRFRGHRQPFTLVSVDSILG